MRGSVTRERVRAEAAALTDEVGVDHLTLTALARRLGIAVPSLYEHVRGLPDLLDALAADAAAELAERLGEALQGRSGRPALLAYAGAWRSWALAHPGRHRLTGRPLADPAAAAGQARIAASCAALLRGYDLAEPAATDAVRLIRGTVLGFVGLEMEGAFRADRPVEASWAAALDALDRALTSWPPAGRTEGR